MAGQKARFADDRDFARDFIRDSGGSHPANLYLCRVFKEDFERKRESSVVFSARLVAETLEGMIYRSDTLAPSEFLAKYHRVNACGPMPTKQNKVDAIKRSILKNGWNGQPLIIHQLGSNQIYAVGPKQRLGSGAHRREAIRQLYASGLIDESVKIPVFDLWSHWDWLYKGALAGLTTKEKIQNPSFFCLYSIHAWRIHSEIFRTLTGYDDDSMPISVSARILY